MSREVKRVPLDFKWPMHKIWPGFCSVFYSIGKAYNFTDEEMELYAEIAFGGEDEMLNQTRSDLPEGDGWQMWEDCTEGSPISPVFKTPEELAQWLADNKASAFGSMTATYEQWLATIKKGYAIGMVCGPNIKLQSGVEYNAILDDDMGDK